MRTDRELHHFVTQQHRFRILQIVLDHTEQLPTGYEIFAFCPDLTRAEVQQYVDELTDEGILREVQLQPEERQEGYPHTFYGLSDRGWRFLLNHDLLDSDGVSLRWQDIDVDDPEKLATDETAPRPEGVETFEKPSGGAGQERLEEYKMVVEQTSDALYMLDSEGRYVLVNDAYVELTGYSREDLLNETPSVVLDDDSMAERRERITDLRNEDAEGASDTWQSTLHTADGAELPVEVTFTVLEYSGEFIGIVGSVRDISDRERRNQELTVLSRVLRHNLGNKLTIVQGYTEVIERRIDDELALEHAERILNTTQRLIRQSEKARDIHDLLREWPPERRPIDVTAMVADAVADLQDEYPHVSFTTEMPDSMWLRVPEELEMALDELLRNAVEHADSEDPTVSVTVEDGEGDETGAIVVEDDGPGIPDEEIKVIESREETALSHSAGLGLWLVNWIVEASRGELRFAESDLGGSSVRMEFPQADPPALTLSM